MFQAPCKVCFFGKEDTGVKAEGKDGKAGTNAPRFLGAFSTPPSSLTSPLIGQFTASHEDYFIYTGNTTPNWTQNRIYQWDATQNRWNIRAFPTANNREYAHLYLAATSAVTANAPEGIFSYIQVLSLVADSIFVNLLAAGEIELNNKYGRGGGRIHSSDYVPGASGWEIKYDGSAEFLNVLIRGNSIFGGTVNIGSTWDNNGNVLSNNTYGALLAKKTGTTNEQIKLNFPNLYNMVNLGLGLNNEHLNERPVYNPNREIRFWAPRKVESGGNLYATMKLRGNYTVAQFYNTIREYFRNIQNIGNTYTATGSLVYYYLDYDPSGSAYVTAAPVIVSSIYYSNTLIMLYGVSSGTQGRSPTGNFISGANHILIEITSTQVRIFTAVDDNEATSSRLAATITSSQPANQAIKADIVFI